MSYANTTRRCLGPRHLTVRFEAIFPVLAVKDGAIRTFRWMIQGASCKVWRLSLGQVYTRGDAECGGTDC